MPDVYQPSEPPCAWHRQMEHGLDRETTERKEGEKEMWEAINSIRNRLPTWAVGVGWIAAIVIGAMGALLAR